MRQPTAFTLASVIQWSVLGGFVTPAHAAADSEAVLEEVVVTGSQIPRPDLTANSTYCRAIDRNPVSGATEELQAFRQNLAVEQRTGLDWQIDWGFDLLGGRMGLKTIGW